MIYKKKPTKTFYFLKNIQGNLKVNLVLSYHKNQEKKLFPLPETLPIEICLLNIYRSPQNPSLLQTIVDVMTIQVTLIHLILAPTVLVPTTWVTPTQMIVTAATNGAATVEKAAVDVRSWVAFEMKNNWWLLVGTFLAVLLAFDFNMFVCNISDLMFYIIILHFYIYYIEYSL